MTYRPTIPSPLPPIAYYRGFRLNYAKAKSRITVTNTLARIMPAGVVQSCVWTAPEDTESLADYLDLSLQQKRAQRGRYEERGFATDVVLTPDRPTVDEVQVSLATLLDVLAMADHVCLPLWGKVRFISSKGNLVPSEMVTVLRERHPDRFGHLNPADAQLITREDQLPEGVSPEDVHTGMNLRSAPAPEPTAEPLPVPQAVATPSVPPAEVQLSRNTGDGWVELVSMVAVQRPYFVRRIVAQARVIYVATAWSPQGPWHVEQRDAMTMMVLGLV